VAALNLYTECDYSLRCFVYMTVRAIYLLPNYYELRQFLIQVGHKMGLICRTDNPPATVRLPSLCAAIQIDGRIGDAVSFVTAHAQLLSALLAHWIPLKRITFREEFS
jgi:hypothetical protein